MALRKGLLVSGAAWKLGTMGKSKLKRSGVSSRTLALARSTPAISPAIETWGRWRWTDRIGKNILGYEYHKPTKRINQTVTWLLFSLGLLLLLSGKWMWQLVSAITRLGDGVKTTFSLVDIAHLIVLPPLPII